MKNKVLVVSQYGDGFSSYYWPFRSFGEFTSDESIIDSNPGSIALVLFTGGEDVSPELYGHEPSRRTYSSPNRDKFEVAVFKKALAAGLPMAGVCRGAQFLCVMAGGTMIQHVDNHGRTHNVRLLDGRVIEMSSTHHQMCSPPPDALVVGWSDQRLSGVYIGSGDEALSPPEKEVEVVYYPNIRAIGMQYHPEIMEPGSPGCQFAAELVNTYLMADRLAA